jgi:uncharacterized membrane protein
MATTTSKNKTGRLAKTASASNIDLETKKNISKIIEIEVAQKGTRTAGERIAEAIAAFCGSMTFVWVHVLWFGTWIIVNAIPGRAFDPFPYTFLTLVVSLEAIFLSTFILISQNHDTRMTERRNHLDLQINLLAEQESTKTLELLRLVARKVGVEDNDPAMDILTAEMEPDKLAEQILEATEEAVNEAEVSGNGKPHTRKPAA